jgi:hypothetical protein
MTGSIQWLCAAILLTALVGCTEEKPAQIVAPTGPAAELARDFDAAAVGTLQGKISWEGPVPTVLPFEVYRDGDGQSGMPPRSSRPNPHVPQVNEHNHGVGQAVVFLRHVDLPKSRPWDHEPVRVELSDWQALVKQGSVTSAIGFVRRGESFQAVSTQKVMHVLRGSGAAFFSLPFPDPDVESTRLLDRVGHVELASGADYFWLRAHLFVDDHPYYTRSDADGRFILPKVPAGTYQVVCWLPNWNVARHERDPESALVSRVEYRAPVEKEASITLSAGETNTVDFAVSARDFGGK